MNRYELTAGKPEKGVKLLQFLRRSFPTAPEWQLLKSLKDKDIKVNDIRAVENLPLLAGDKVTWFTQWAASDIEIVYEDGNLLIINKPAGMNSDAQSDGISAHSWAAERGRGEYRPRLVHRLDNQTSGLLILAKNDEAETTLLNAFRERLMQKTYTCMVLGQPIPAQARLNAYMLKDPATSRVKVYDRPVAGAREIVTDYRTLKAGDESSRLEVRPQTGRTHQIRAHLAYIGHPILGDDKYGDYDANKRFHAKRLLLAATELRFNAGSGLDYLNGKTFSAEAPF